MKFLLIDAEGDAIAPFVDVDVSEPAPDLGEPVAVGAEVMGERPAQVGQIGVAGDDHRLAGTGGLGRDKAGPGSGASPRHLVCIPMQLQARHREREAGLNTEGGEAEGEPKRGGMSSDGILVGR